MIHGKDDLNDDLSDLLGAAATGPAAKPIYRAPDRFVPAVERVFTEACSKCGGSGRFVSYSGRTFGQCFACKGNGKFTYKTSSEQRAKARAGAADRKARKAAEYAEEFKAEIQWVREAAQRQSDNALQGRKVWEFPTKLAEGFAKYGSFTDGQVEAIRKCMARDEQRKVERAAERAAREAAAPVVDASAIEKAFAVARENAARKGQMGIWLKPMLLRSGAKDDPAAIDVAVKPAKKYEGVLYVTQGDTYLGKVTGGKFIRAFACDDATEAAVVKVCADPLEGAKAYGKAWSRCMVCDRTLTNDGSIEAGIGPICAEKYGW